MYVITADQVRSRETPDAVDGAIRELTAQRDTNSSTKLIDVMRRNDELEQENAVLRTRLSHAVAALGVPDQSGGMCDVRFDQKHPSGAPLLNFSMLFLFASWCLGPWPFLAKERFSCFLLSYPRPLPFRALPACPLFCLASRFSDVQHLLPAP